MKYEYGNFIYEKTVKAKVYSRQLTFSLALICLIFFGTILSYQATTTTYSKITGMAVAVGSGVGGESIASVSDFIWAIRTSPQVTEMKLFFYMLWVLVVLIGTAISYEFQAKE